MARADYDRMAAVYDAGRSLSDQALESWRRVLGRYLPPSTGLPVLDLGSGTGRFSEALASWFGVDVIGVEPAKGMIARAVDKGPVDRVGYVAGRAESIPLRDGCCGAAWLSTVIHHIDDLGECGRELGRVLNREGRVLIRSAFPGRLDHILHFEFFPGARRIAETFPTVEQTIDAFATGRFELESLESVPQVSAASLSELRDRIRTRADSTLEPLSDEEFAQGMEALERAIEAEPAPSPVISRLDLLVLRRR